MYPQMSISKSHKYLGRQRMMLLRPWTRLRYWKLGGNRETLQRGNAPRKGSKSAVRSSEFFGLKPEPAEKQPINGGNRVRRFTEGDLGFPFYSFGVHDGDFANHRAPL
jgi:hypothetical protein